jgi:uncharacterized protein (DUF433 family)
VGGSIGTWVINKKLEVEHFNKYITANPAILCGKLTIKGTRISVEMIVRSLGEGATIDEMIEGYPHIKTEEILACLRYAASVLDLEEKLVEFRTKK